MKKREAGEPHGCNDTSSPENSSPYQLSRVLDVLDLLDDAQLPKQAIWDAFSYGLRTDFNYSKWCYEPVTGEEVNDPALQNVLDNMTLEEFDSHLELNDYQE